MSLTVADLEDKNGINFEISYIEQHAYEVYGNKLKFTHVLEGGDIKYYIVFTYNQKYLQDNYGMDYLIIGTRLTLINNHTINYPYGQLHLQLYDVEFGELLPNETIKLTTNFTISKFPFNPTTHLPLLGENFHGNNWLRSKIDVRNQSGNLIGASLSDSNNNHSPLLRHIPIKPGLNHSLSYSRPSWNLKYNNDINFFFRTTIAKPGDVLTFVNRSPYDNSYGWTNLTSNFQVASKIHFYATRGSKLTPLGSANISSNYSWGLFNSGHNITLTKSYLQPYRSTFLGTLLIYHNSINGRTTGMVMYTPAIFLQTQSEYLQVIRDRISSQFSSQAVTRSIHKFTNDVQNLFVHTPHVINEDKTGPGITFIQNTTLNFDDNDEDIEAYLLDNANLNLLAQIKNLIVYELQARKNSIDKNKRVYTSRVLDMGITYVTNPSIDFTTNKADDIANDVFSYMESQVGNDSVVRESTADQEILNINAEPYSSLAKSAASNAKSGIVADVTIPLDQIGTEIRLAANNVKTTIENEIIARSLLPRFSDEEGGDEGVRQAVIDAGNAARLDESITNVQEIYDRAEAAGDAELVKICIMEGQQVLLDTGYTNIENVKVGDTINGESVVKVFKQYNENKLVKFPKNYFGANMPNEDVYMTYDHLVYNPKTKQMQNAGMFWFQNGLPVEDPPKKFVYNILLKKWKVMNVNNMKCESLCPYNQKAIDAFIENNVHDQSYVDFVNDCIHIEDVSDVFVQDDEIKPKTIALKQTPNKEDVCEKQKLNVM